MEFEWNARKNAANKKKHGVSFENAVLVFGDPMRLDVLDVEHSTREEERRIVLGKVDRVLYVVYTERKEVVRIISARVATAFERKVYYEI